MSSSRETVIENARKQIPQYIPRRRSILSFITKHNVPALIAASFEGREPLLKFLRYLLSSNQDAKRPLPGVNIALLAAISRDCPESVEALVLGAGADPFEKIGIATAVHLAAERGKCRALAAILGLDYSRRATYVADSFGLCPIHVAAMYGHSNAVSLLVRHDPAALVIKVSHFIQQRGQSKSKKESTSIAQWSDILNINDIRQYRVKVNDWFFQQSGGCLAMHMAAGNKHANVLQELTRLAYVAECGPAFKKPLNFSKRTCVYAPRLDADLDHLQSSADDVPPSNVEHDKSLHQHMQNLALSQRDRKATASQNLQCPVELQVHSFLEEVLEQAVRLCSSASYPIEFCDNSSYNVNVHEMLEARDDEEYAPIHSAALTGNEETLRCLVNLGANLFSRGHFQVSVLHEAISNDDPDLICTLVKEFGLRIEDRDINGYTPLHYASYFHKEQDNHITNLLDLGADVNSRSYENNTPLIMTVCERRQRGPFMQLLSAGADVHAICALEDPHSALTSLARKGYFDTLLSALSDIKTNEGSSILEHKVSIVAESVTAGASCPVLKKLLKLIELETLGDEGRCLAWLALEKAPVYNIDVVRLLLKRGADANYFGEDGRTPLHYVAAKDECVELAQVLIDHGAYVNVLSNDSNGLTALHVAARCKSAKMIQVLHSAGAILDLEANLDGGTPLHYAVHSGSLRCVKLLVEKGANLSTLDKEGQTPLHLSAYKNLAEISAFLVNYGSPINARTINGVSPLHFGYKYHSYRDDITHLLISKGACLDAVDRYADSPLHDFAAFGHEISVRAAIEAGANVHARNNKGRDPYLTAARNGKLRNMVILLSHGADLDSRDSSGRSALHLAASNGHTHIVEWLMQKGADVMAVDSEGSTPIESAAKSQHWRTFKALLVLTGDNCTLNVIAKKTLFEFDSPCQSMDGEEDMTAENVTSPRQTHEDCSLDETRLRCGICLMMLRNGEEVRTFRCKHVFHDTCTVQWLLNGKDNHKLRCPLCRQTLAGTGDEDTISA